MSDAVSSGRGGEAGSVGRASAPALGPQQRRAALARLGTEVFDVLVLGGGVTGCGVALDAASRGLSVALVEKRDWAAGTSSRSSKLIHGGLRYLENLDIELVREALHERRLLVDKIAPHLVHPTPILFPLKRKVWDRAFMGSGLLLYDALAGLHPAMPRHHHLSRAACLRAVPSLREDAFTGGIRFYDAQVDDARYSLMLARTAASLGAVCASAAGVVSFLHAGEKVTGARVADLESGAYTLDCGEADLGRARQLVQRYEDLSLGYVDAAVIACAERNGGRILTFDLRDFGVVAAEGTITILFSDTNAPGGWYGGTGASVSVEGSLVPSPASGQKLEVRASAGMVVAMPSMRK